MRNYKTLLKSSILSIALSILFVSSVMAEGTVTMSVDKENCQVQEEITVTVNAEGGEDAATAPEISIVYDPNRLSFIDCSAPYGGGGGGLITIADISADVRFTTLSGGEAEITVNAVFDGDGANPAGASITVMVEGEDTASLLSGDSESSETGIEAGTVSSSDGTKFVSSVFANEFMPVGFYKTTVTYEEQMVEAAQFDMGNIVLLYVTDESGNNGNFDIYDETTGELSDFLQIMGIENKFIIALKASEDVTIPKDFTKATLQWNDQVLEAYSYTGNAENLEFPASDFFLIYGMSSEGNKGFYMYDQKEGTYQRYVSGLHGGKKSVDNDNQGGILAAITSSDESSDSVGLDIKLIIIAILAVITIVLLILFIVTLVKLKDYESYDYIDEDEEYEPVAAPQVSGSQPSFVRNQATDNLPNLDEKPIRKPVSNADTGEIQLSSKNKKMTASDLVERDMSYEDSNVFNTQYRDEPEDNFKFRNKANRETEDRNLSKAELKAEAKAAKKEAKRIKKQYGENGYVDWESFGEAVKKNDQEMPTFTSNPKYVMDEDKSQKQVERVPVKQAEKPTPKQQLSQAELDRLRNDDYEKENPAAMMKNIPANDNNKPVQPKPVQQYDFDDDFEFEYLNLDDDD